MNKAIFLDRDGVIIENKATYVRSLDDIIFIPQALPAMELLKRSSFKIFIITNQSAVGRGLLSIELAHLINKKVVERIVNRGGRVDGVFMCPHTPDDLCACRKPKPGLILNAASKYNLDLQNSIMIGDALTDVLAGQAAGIKRNILVLTGRGIEQYSKWDRITPKAFEFYDDLLEVISSIYS